ncbi:MAG: helix-turn-helix transcriptional regulator [Armatimonadetes bacterium]|nr:helix-turn-helix transcriptional regulator [Armatimonadota bacterium]
MPSSANIGAVIRRLRERWRLKQQDVVEYARLDRSSSYISSIETGKTSPTLAELEAMSIVFRTTVSRMIQEAGGEQGEAPTADDPATRLVALFRGLDPDEQELALAFLQLLTDRRQEKALPGRR